MELDTDLFIAIHLRSGTSTDRRRQPKQTWHLPPTTWLGNFGVHNNRIHPNANIGGFPSITAEDTNVLRVSL
jgi:hypothetical protein